jgi:hypothetical protein
MSNKKGFIYNGKISKILHFLRLNYTEQFIYEALIGTKYATTLKYIKQVKNEYHEN